MDGDKILRKRKTGIALLAGFFLFAFVLIAFIPSGFADDDGDNIAAGTNFIALHDKGSRQYEKHCLDCHADVLAQQTNDLDTQNIPVFHVAMIPFVPGEKNEERCAWCHRSVDLVQKSNGGLRRHVDADLCRLCHGPDGPAEKKFYLTGLSQTNPDGPALYGLVCAACHRDLANSKVDGESARDIQKKIDENEGGMGPLRVLSVQEIQAIADALAQQGGGDD